MGSAPETPLIHHLLPLHHALDALSGRIDFWEQWAGVARFQLNSTAVADWHLLELESIRFLAALRRDTSRKMKGLLEIFRRARGDTSRLLER